MATRFYLANTTVDAPVSGFTIPGSGWASAMTNAVLKKATTTKASSTTGSLTAGGGAATGNRQQAAHLSAPLFAQTITGTVKGQIRCQEVSAGDDRFPQIRVLVVSGDGSVVRGTLLDFDNSALSHEWATSLTSRQFPRGGAVAVSSVAALAGDRIAIETGVGRSVISGNNITMIYQDDNATDLPEDETTTAANNSWLEFSQTLLFVAGGLPPFQNRAI